MADYDSSLPIRSEADGADERVHVKIVDGATPSQMATVDSDLNVHVEAHGNDPAGVDRILRTSEQGHAAINGVYDVASNTDPSQVGLVAHTRAATPGDSDQTKRLTAITNSTVCALDVAIRDEAGAAFSASNPLPVTSVDSEGTEVNDHSSATVAASGSTNHDYTVTALTTLKLSQVHASASGKMKVVVSVETGVASGSFTTRFVGFNSTANPNVHIPVNENITVAAGVRVRVAKTNLDNQSQDLYSTISGHEI